MSTYIGCNRSIFFNYRWRRLDGWHHTSAQCVPPSRWLSNCCNCRHIASWRHELTSVADIIDEWCRVCVACMQQLSTVETCFSFLQKRGVCLDGIRPEGQLQLLKLLESFACFKQVPVKPRILYTLGMLLFVLVVYKASQFLFFTSWVLNGEPSQLMDLAVDRRLHVLLMRIRVEKKHLSRYELLLLPLLMRFYYMTTSSRKRTNGHSSRG